MEVKDKPAEMVLTLLRRPEKVHVQVTWERRNIAVKGCPVEMNHNTDTYVGKNKAF